MGEKTPFMKYAIQVVEDALHRMKNDECDESSLAHMIEQVNAENKGYYREEDFYNYDEAMREMKVGSRQGLKVLLAKHGIGQVKIKNKPVGFLKTKVNAAAAKERRQPVKKRRKKNE